MVESEHFVESSKTEKISFTGKLRYIPRVGLAVVFAATMVAYDLINRYFAVEASPDSSGEICNVGVDVKGIKFIDKGGKKGIFDQGIDEKVGAAGGFTAFAIGPDRNRILGSTNVGADGFGKIRGISEPCNSVGPEGHPALSFFVRTGESQILLPVTATDNFAAIAIVGEELVQEATPVVPPRPPSTPVPIIPTPVPPPPSFPPIVPTIVIQGTNIDEPVSVNIENSVTVRQEDPVKVEVDEPLGVKIEPVETPIPVETSGNIGIVDDEGNVVDWEKLISDLRDDVNITIEDYWPLLAAILGAGLLAGAGAAVGGIAAGQGRERVVTEVPEATRRRFEEIENELNRERERVSREREAREGAERELNDARDRLQMETEEARRERDLAQRAGADVAAEKGRRERAEADLTTTRERVINLETDLAKEKEASEKIKTELENLKKRKRRTTRKSKTTEEIHSHEEGGGYVGR